MWSEDRDSRSLMAWLLQPYTIEEFGRAYYETAPLVIDRGDSEYYKRYFSLHEMERIVYGTELTQNDLRLFRDGMPARPESYLRPSSRTDKSEKNVSTGEVIDADRMSSLFAHGCTVVLDKVQTYSDSAAALCRGIESFFRHAVNANVYMTPSNSQGFAVHFDTHDTVILQIEGSKHWRVYGSVVTLPLFAQKYDKKKHPSGEVVMEMDLHAGDLLYLPRGVMHEARSTGELSLHVTVGLHPALWTDVLKESVKMAGLDAVELRRAALGDRLAGPRRDEELLEAIGRVFDPEQLAKALENIENKFTLERRNGLDGQLAQLANLSTLSGRSRVAIREHMLFELKEEESSVALLFSGKTIKLPTAAASMIRELKSAASLEIAALARHDANAMAIVRRLIEEGFAVALEPDEFDTAVIA